ncbi:MAG: peptide-methionine (R)-S-oxide reductase MsrB [Sphingobacteriaceae bacterium]|nr:peptide-methionine (R)-S-oxide reductase MsrB [Sphingobacteriaceae bacterium]
MIKPILLALSFLLAFTACQAQEKNKSTSKNTPVNTTETPNFLNLSDEEWAKRLKPEEYRVLRQHGTERPYTGEYDQHWEAGTYVCKGCGADLFTSNTKFDAGCGWPSFYEGIDKSKIKEVLDKSFGMTRVEVRCARCDGHLGHVFNDGPQPTGMRYCINSVSLGFVKK